MLQLARKLITRISKSRELSKTRLLTRRLSLILLALIVASGVLAGVQIADAQSLQQQINDLRNQNNQTQGEVNSLEVEAAGYQETLNALQAQIDMLVTEIRANEAKRDAIVAQIAQKEIELAHQQTLIGQSIRAQYLEGEMSTIEMVATSKNLSEYLDKQQYRDSVQNKINTILEEIKAIKAQLAEQKATQEKLLAEQRVMEQQLGAQRSEQARLLSLNQAQQAALEGQIRTNNSRISDLRRQQARENARLWGGGRLANIPDTTGYPWAGVQPFPNSYPDPWGMYKRQCVSYTAWKVHKDGKRMPYWGGRGNAKNWANNARAEGIPVHSTPQRGDIAVSTRGTYGHVMYVEEVYGNGRMRISQYNASWDGRYSEAVISTAGLEYVRFP